MLTNICECAGVLMEFILSMMLSRYVFLIPTLPKWWQQALFDTLVAAGCMAVCWFFGRIPALVLMGISIGIYIFLTGSGNKRRYFRTLRVIPIMGMTFGILMPPIEIPAILLQLRTDVLEVYSLVMYVLILLALVYFCIRGREWRRTFREDLQYRHLEYWEHSLLYVIGVLMFFFAPTLSTLDGLNMEESAGRFQLIRLSCVSSLVCFIVTMTIIILIMRGSNSAHLREQVMAMQHNIIITMADIVESRDNSTGGHIKRTAKYVEIIAVNLKLDHLYSNILTDQYIADMMIAAPLHDIGKIHIPDAVLKKNGRFTEEEFQIMKSHTIAGKKLLMQAERTLGKSSYLDIAVQMAGYHHEWWNGRGYPEGLKGQDIPLCARIMAVADVFDAIVSQRCYKGAMRIEDAFELIRKESGTHFDPVIVEAFLGAREEIAAVATEFKEHPVELPEEEVLPLAGDSVPVRPELEKQEETEQQPEKAVVQQA